MSSQFSATMHGSLASAVCAVLGIAAHSLGGGHLPSTAQWGMLLGLALCVGLVRAGQIRSVEQARARGRLRISGRGALALLSIGQAGTHAALSLMDGGMGHGLLPGPVMLAWHALAVPAAAAVLFAAERLGRALAGGLTLLRALLGAPEPTDEIVGTGRVDRDHRVLRPSPMVHAAGVRGPPLPV